MPLTGSTEWASYQTSFALPQGLQCDRIKLNVVIEGEGRGTVWVREIEVLREPSPQ